MNWPSDADLVRLLEYCRRHSPDYLVDAYTAAIDRRIVLGLILRDGPEVHFDADRPTLITVSDDVSRSTGPSAFDQATWSRQLGAAARRRSFLRCRNVPSTPTPWPARSTSSAT